MEDDFDDFVAAAPSSAPPSMPWPSTSESSAHRQGNGWGSFAVGAAAHDNDDDFGDFSSFSSPPQPSVAAPAPASVQSPSPPEGTLSATSTRSDSFSIVPSTIHSVQSGSDTDDFADFVQTSVEHSYVHIEVPVATTAPARVEEADFDDFTSPPVAASLEAAPVVSALPPQQHSSIHFTTDDFVPTPQPSSDQRFGSFGAAQLADDFGDFATTTVAPSHPSDDDFGEFATTTVAPSQLAQPVDEDFGDFATTTTSSFHSAQPVDEASPAPLQQTLLAQHADDDFGDFAAEPVQVTSAPPSQASIDDFGLFAATAEPVQFAPPPPAQHADDDFGGFATAPLTQPVQQAPTPQPAQNADDDFGDFAATTPSQAPAENAHDDFGDFTTTAPQQSQPADFGKFSATTPSQSTEHSTFAAGAQVISAVAVSTPPQPAPETEFVEGFPVASAVPVEVDFGDFAATPSLATEQSESKDGTVILVRPPLSELETDRFSSTTAAFAQQEQEQSSLRVFADESIALTPVHAVGSTDTSLTPIAPPLSSEASEEPWLSSFAPPSSSQSGAESTKPFVDFGPISTVDAATAPAIHDDFGSFGAAPSPSNAAPAIHDDFGSFGATPAPIAAAFGAATSFGDFGSFDSEPSASGFGDFATSNPFDKSSAANDDFGSFDSKPSTGDFGGFNAFGSSNTADDDDDDFGDFDPPKPSDFGNFGTTAAAAVDNAPTSLTPSSTLSSSFFKSSNPDAIRKAIVSQLQDLTSLAAPITPSSSTGGVQVQPLSQTLVYNAIWSSAVNVNSPQSGLAMPTWKSSELRATFHAQLGITSELLARAAAGTVTPLKLAVSSYSKPHGKSSTAAAAAKDPRLAAIKTSTVAAGLATGPSSPSPSPSVNDLDNFFGNGTLDKSPSQTSVALTPSKTTKAASEWIFDDFTFDAPPQSSVSSPSLATPSKSGALFDLLDEDINFASPASTNVSQPMLFASATLAPSLLSQPPITASSMMDNDDFVPFGSAPVSAGPQSASADFGSFASTTTAANDDFGSFGAPTTANDDGFGAFGSFASTTTAAAATTLASIKPVVAATADFGSFGSSFAAAATSAASMPISKPASLGLDLEDFVSASPATVLPASPSKFAASPSSGVLLPLGLLNKSGLSAPAQEIVNNLPDLSFMLSSTIRFPVILSSTS